MILNRSPEPRQHTVREKDAGFVFAFPSVIFSSDASEPPIVLFLPLSVSEKLPHVYQKEVDFQSIYLRLKLIENTCGNARRFPFSQLLSGIWEGLREQTSAHLRCF